jgi:hypothetical protein
VPTGWSAYFDGTGDYLTVADNAAFTVGSGNFTAEAWVYPTASPNQPIIMGHWDGVGGGTGLSWVLILSNDSARNLRFAMSTNGSGVVQDQVSSTPLPLNAWSHVALVRNGDVFTLYLNGVAATNGSYTISAGAVLFDATNALSVGGSSSGGQPYQGYISNARFVVGTAVYTSAFTPQAPLGNVLGTTLLTCTNNAAVYDGVGKTVLETAGNARVVNGVRKYGTGSIYFDGTGDYLVTNGDPSQFAFGTGDFTIEFWLQSFDMGASADKALIDFRPSGPTNGAYPYLYIYQSKIRYYFQTADRITQSDTLTLSVWHHVALSREGTSTKLFVDGVEKGSYTNGDNCSVGSQRPVIGCNTGLGANFNGYIDDLRVTKGVARYTLPFDPPGLHLAR